MKKTFIGLFVVLSFPLMASNEYTGERILDYLPAGHYVGSGCSVDIDLSSSKDKVSVSIEAGSDYATFNTSWQTQEDILESPSPDRYKASFTLVPDDGYSGYKADFIEIKIQNKKAFISIEMKRRFLGFWKTERKASCFINKKF